MGRAIAIRTDYTNSDVRRIPQRVKNAGQARRLLAIAAVLDGTTREEVATIGGMDRQTLPFPGNGILGARDKSAEIILVRQTSHSRD